MRSCPKTPRRETEKERETEKKREVGREGGRGGWASVGCDGLSYPGIVEGSIKARNGTLCVRRKA